MLPLHVNKARSYEIKLKVINDLTEN